jgi:RimJ/RimL family protein N-acetyltransferase
MNANSALFTGKDLRLTPIDREKDPEVESRWTHDLEYLRMLDSELARPLTPAQVKKKYEEIEKESDQSRSRFYFALRTTSEPERLLGFLEIPWVMWNQGVAGIRLGIGDPADRRKGYGRQALQLMLRYAFDELNLYRLVAQIPAYNRIAIRLFEGAGFVEEVRRREALHRAGQRWDALEFGLLREEWEAGRG